MAAAENHGISCLVVGIMDQLWFHQAILFPLKIPQSSASSEQPPLLSEQNSSNNQVDVVEEYSNEQEDRDDEKEERVPVRLQISISDRKISSSCLSISPASTRKRQFSGTRRRLSKTMSCKSFCELELEEVKGFMDLGFTFDKQHLNKRMMSVLPGLQRLDLNHHRSEEEERFEEERGVVIRPYLSEAWLVKRPDLPLLNLRVPRVSTADDMKKHLKYWAKTVASAIQLE